VFAAAALSAVALYGCGVAPEVTPTAVPASTSTSAPAQQPATPDPTPWAPPTALAGTPIPGAEATLTAAPQLRREMITIANTRGEKITMQVEIADTEPSRELGLMFRPAMDPYAGMLFDFGADTTGGFWMANTILPLSIAFIKADGSIIDIQDMKPLDRTGISAAGPYRYALEANQGFFSVNAIEVGNKVTLPGQGSVFLPGMPGCSYP
jgi:uncharacterized membrane protein (UPF0127 family)